MIFYPLYRRFFQVTGSELQGWDSYDAFAKGLPPSVSYNVAEAKLSTQMDVDIGSSSTLVCIGFNFLPLLIESVFEDACKGGFNSVCGYGSSKLWIFSIGNQ